MWPLWILSKVALKIAVSFSSKIIIKGAFVFVAKTIQSRLFFTAARWGARMGLRKVINYVLVTDKIRLLFSRRGLNLPSQTLFRSLVTSQLALSRGPGGRRKLSIVRTFTTVSEGLTATADQLASSPRFKKWRKHLRDLYLSEPMFPYYSDTYPGSCCGPSFQQYGNSAILLTAPGLPSFLCKRETHLSLNVGLQQIQQPPILNYKKLMKITNT